MHVHSPTFRLKTLLIKLAAYKTMVSNCALQYLIERLFQGLHPHQTFNIIMMQVLEQKVWLHLLE